MVLSMSRPWKHPKTGVYYYRKVVPEAMRQLFGLVEVRKTLGTKDPRQAALRHAQVAEDWERLRRGPVMTDMARAFVQRLSDPQELTEDILEADLRAAGILDERELREGEWPDRTTGAQKAIARAIESRGLASWLERQHHTPLNPGQRKGLMEAVEAILLQNDQSKSVEADQPAQCVLTLTGLLEGWWMVDGGQGYRTQAINLREL